MLERIGLYLNRLITHSKIFRWGSRRFDNFISQPENVAIIQRLSKVSVIIVMYVMWPYSKSIIWLFLATKVFDWAIIRFDNFLTRPENVGIMILFKLLIELLIVIVIYVTWPYSKSIVQLFLATHAFTWFKIRFENFIYRPENTVRQNLRNRALVKLFKYVLGLLSIYPIWLYSEDIIWLFWVIDYLLTIACLKYMFVDLEQNIADICESLTPDTEEKSERLKTIIDIISLLIFLLFIYPKK